VHKEAVHLLSLQPASITSSGVFKPECNDLSQFREDTGGPSMPLREFNHTSSIELKCACAAVSKVIHIDVDFSVLIFNIWES